MRGALVLLALAGLAPGASAQTGPRDYPGKRLISRVVPGEYRLDPLHSQAGFTVERLGISEFSGRFSRPTGTLSVDPANPSAASLDISVPVATVSTGATAIDTALRGNDFLDASRYPLARFSMTRLDAAGTTAYVAGRLTLHGITRPVILKAEFIGGGIDPADGATHIGFHVTGHIDRSDFGVDAGLPVVADRVELSVNAEFVKRKPD